PMIVEGQVHGGLTQGIGQALTEGCHYDKESGQLVTGSYLDYCMPRADDVPAFKVGTKETPCTHNPLGVKGCGEAGAIGAPAAVMNALSDALGVRDIEMPATPQRIWRACQESKMKKAAYETRMYSFSYQKAKSVADAAKVLAKDGDAKLLAGGQSLIAAMKLRLAHPSAVIDLGTIKELSGIKGDSKAVAIGAMTRHAEVASSAAVKKADPWPARLGGRA